MTELLLDTRVVLWWLADDPSLSAEARQLVEDPANAPLVSVASYWEIGIKRGTGKLDVPDELPETIRDEGFTTLAIEPEDAWSVADLPDVHRDPFDRMLIAQALKRSIPIVTADPRFAEYSVEVRW